MKQKKLVIPGGFAIILLFYLTWCLATISNRGVIFEILHLLSTLVLMGSYVLWSKNLKFSKIAFAGIHQLQIINCLFLVAFLVITCKDIARGDRSVFMLLSDVLWLIGLESFCCFHPISWKEIGKKAGRFVKEHIALLVLVGVCVVLAVFPTMLQFKWDGALYEQAVRRMDIHSMSSMAAYAHIAQGYGILVCLVRMIYDDPQIAMAITNLLLYVSSILAFYGIMGEVLSKASTPKCISTITGNGYGTDKGCLCTVTVNLLTTAIYAVSPLTLGMVNYYSLDYATMCLFVLMLYFLVKKQWILQGVAAFFAVFTKEPAIVLYGGMCIGLVIYDWQTIKDPVKKRFHYLFSQTRYYGMLLTAVLWYVTYKILGGWNAGNSSVGVDINYIGNKLIVMYVINFTWIFLVLLLISLIQGRKKKACKEHWIYAVLSGLVLFTLFQCGFQTVNHMRYAAVGSVLVYVVALSAFVKVSKNQVRIAGTAVICLLLFFSSYRTIDPVTFACLEEVPTGNGVMVSTGITVPGDSMIYNKQMLDLEKAINGVIGVAVEEQYEIYVPTYETVTNLFDGLMGSFEEKEGYAVTIQYWDQKKKERTLYEKESTIPYTMTHIQKEELLSEIIGSGRGKTACYLYMDCMGKEIADKIRQSYEIVTTYEVTNGVFKVTMLVFQK